MKQIKIRDKEYNCSNRIYYHIQGLESENRVISMELLGHENNELQQQKEIERLNKENTILRQNSQYLVKQNDELEEVINNAIEYIEQHNDYFLLKREVKKVLEILKGVDKE